MIKIARKQLKRISVTAGASAAIFLGNALPAFAQVDPNDCTEETVVTGTIQDGANCAAPIGAEPNLFADGGIFQKITNALLFLVGAISVVMLIIGGIRYVVSAGDQNAVTGAKNTILYAVVGIVVAFLAFAAVRFVTGQLAGGE